MIIDADAAQEWDTRRAPHNRATARCTWPVDISPKKGSAL